MKTLDKEMYVSGQISENDLDEAKKQGVEIVVSNRPDGEESGQPDAATIAKWCKERGLDFKHIPYSSGGLTGQMVEDFAKTTKGKKTFGFCKSGMRASVIWAMAEAMANRQDTDTLINKAAQAGYDLNPVRPMLESARPKA